MSLQSKITPHCAVQSEPSSYEKVQSELASLIQSEVFYLLLFFFFTLFFFSHNPSCLCAVFVQWITYLFKFIQTHSTSSKRIDIRYVI